MSQSQPAANRVPSTFACGSMQAAAYIVGCLAASGLIEIDVSTLADREKCGETLSEAIYIVNDSIVKLGLWDWPDDLPDLPFMQAGE